MCRIPVTEASSAAGMLRQVEGIAEEVIFDHLHATAFQQTPLGRTILGPASNVRSITRADLADYVASNYTAPRMVRRRAEPPLRTFPAHSSSHQSFRAHSESFRAHQLFHDASHDRM